jgi:hypothetical protein
LIPHLIANIVPSCGGVGAQDDLPELVAALLTRPGHEAVRTMIGDILRHGFGVEYLALDQEVQMPECAGGPTR